MSHCARLVLAGFLATAAVFSLSGCGGDDDIVTASDVDGDGVDNTADNCLTAPNPLQTDTDADGFGDACDCNRDPQACLAESTTSGGCFDGQDNDGDGLADAADPNCGAEGAPQGNCADGVDNDGDRILDCTEPACAGAPGCPGGP